MKHIITFEKIDTLGKYQIDYPQGFTQTKDLVTKEQSMKYRELLDTKKEILSKLKELKKKKKPVDVELVKNLKEVEKELQEYPEYQFVVDSPMDKARETGSIDIDEPSGNAGKYPVKIKHLESFEDYSLNELKLFNNDKKMAKRKFQKFENMYSQPKLFSLLEEYIKLNVSELEFQFDLDDEDFLIDEYEFVEPEYNKTYFFNIRLKEEEEHDHFENIVFFTFETFNDLLLFLEKPEMYKSTKNYNL